MHAVVRSPTFRKWLRRLGMVLAALVMLLIVLPWTIGSFMPREHVGRGERVLAAPIDEVWKSVSGFDEMGHWAPQLANMTRVADVEGLPSYELRSENAIITFTFTEVSEPSRLVVELRDSADAYGGVWTYELSEVDGGTRVAITEEGWTRPSLLSFHAVGVRVRPHHQRLPRCARAPSTKLADIPL